MGSLRSRLFENALRIVFAIQSSQYKNIRLCNNLGLSFLLFSPFHIILNLLGAKQPVFQCSLSRKLLRKVFIGHLFQKFD